MTSSNGNIFLCARNSPVSGELPAQRPVTQSFDVFFALRLIIGWVNTREAGDLRRYHANHDVIVIVRFQQQRFQYTEVWTVAANTADFRWYPASIIDFKLLFTFQ